ncbi:hypothetical protein FZC84_14370 [Rossellomorea vietnamensis]|uniref:Uncharacterized protein n=2 Tax=Bacillaceae TaxID=186817 RepID=A0A5D4MBC2_9BACI|nr:hypothetical protein FZC84_14370 [Rossellomorea vietnamensis]
MAVPEAANSVESEKVRKMMADKSSKIIMTGILICLIIIAFKPVPSFQSNMPASLDVSNGEAVVQLGENRIAVVDTNLNSGMRGEVFALEFNEEEETFDLIGRYNYVDFFHNPQNYDQ